MAANYMRPIRILIADDHHKYRERLRQIIDAHDGLEIVGKADDGHKAIALAKRLQPDVVLMDINMLTLDCILATGQIIEENSTMSIIVLTLDSQDERLFTAVRAGAQGFLLRGAAANAIVETIQAVFQGKIVLDPHLMNMLFNGFRALSV